MNRLNITLLLASCLVALAAASGGNDFNQFVDSAIKAVKQKYADKIKDIHVGDLHYLVDHIGPVKLPISGHLDVSDIRVFGVETLNRSGDALRLKIGDDDRTILPLGVYGLEIDLFGKLSLDRDRRNFFAFGHEMNLTISVQDLSVVMSFDGNKDKKTVKVNDFLVNKMEGLKIHFKGNFGDSVINKVLDVTVKALHNKIEDFLSAKGKQFLSENTDKFPEALKNILY